MDTDICRQTNYSKITPPLAGDKLCESEALNRAT